jgi:hypothetical protein
MHLLVAALTAIQGTVKAEGSHMVVPRAELSIPALQISTVSDARGEYTMSGIPAGRWKLSVIAIGYAPYETTVQVPMSGVVRIDVELTPRVKALPRVDVRAVGSPSDTANEVTTAQTIFEREVTPGVTSISRRELRNLPTIIEPDVLRGLQTMPGVTPLNEFDAQLYVRGGAADQNTFLIDGARVFGPYHLFGMNGAFNPGAVQNAEFFRGAFPARYGGVLSSIVAIDQRDGASGAPIEGGLSLLGARAMIRGSVDSGRATWMIAGRRSHADLVFGGAMPYAFYDGQTRFTFAPSSRHRFTLSTFGTGDRFRMFFGDGDERLFSQWSNGVGALHWEWKPSDRWSATTSLSASRYRGDIGAGNGPTAITRNRLDIGTARVELRRATNRTTLRLGTEIERGSVSLEGDSLEGGYFSGRVARSFLSPALYGEIDWRIGRVRLAPGLRAIRDTRAGDVLFEPRVSARAQLTDALSFSVSANRAHQSLSSLRDERTVIPGAAMWFVHPTDAPTSRSESVSGALDLRVGGGFSMSAEVYAREFSDVPHWRPVGIRDLSSVSYDDGSTKGIEVAVRRYGEQISGWLGVGLGRTRFTDRTSNEEYDAVWDRPVSATGALFARPWSRLHLSLRVDYGTGHPFWPFAGNVLTPRFQPLVGVTDVTRLTPVWSDQQLRLPAYFRVDLGARTAVRWLGMDVEPYLNFQNLFGRPNVIHYQLKATFLRPDGTFDSLFPGTTRLFPIAAPKVFIPTIGFDVRF